MRRRMVPLLGMLAVVVPGHAALGGPVEMVSELLWWAPLQEGTCGVTLAASGTLASGLNCAALYLGSGGECHPAGEGLSRCRFHLSADTTVFRWVHAGGAITRITGHCATEGWLEWGQVGAVGTTRARTECSGPEMLLRPGTCVELGGRAEVTFWGAHLHPRAVTGLPVFPPSGVSADNAYPVQCAR